VDWGEATRGGERVTGQCGGVECGADAALSLCVCLSHGKLLAEKCGFDLGI
jgi:hypothetical protein